MTLQSQQTFYSDQNDLFRANYSTFEHAFTDAGVADAKQAGPVRSARQRKRVGGEDREHVHLEVSAPRASSAWTPDDAAKFQADGSKR